MTEPPGGESWPVGQPVDLRRSAGRELGWRLASDDLNATLVAWAPGRGVVEHVNDELDVLIVVLDGEGVVAVDGASHMMRAPSAILVPRGAARAISAGAPGLRYLSIHRRRTLQIDAPAVRR